MSRHSNLDEIESYLDSLEAGLNSLEADDLDIAAPTLDGDLELDDVARARALFSRLNALRERTDGQRVRVAGEIAGLRRRAANDGHRRSPSTFDRAV